MMMASRATTERIANKTYSLGHIAKETLLEAVGKNKRIRPHTSVPTHPVNWKIEKKNPLYSLVVSAKPTA